MNPSLWIARRLRLNDSGSGANTTGVIIASIGMAVAVIVMEITLAVVLGFKTGITERVLGFDPDVTVLPAYDYQTGESAEHITASAQVKDLITDAQPGANVSLRLSQPGILKTDSDFAAVYFTAYDSAHDYAFERGNIVEGEFPDYKASGNQSDIVISRSTARALGLSAGEKITACFIVNEAVKSRRFSIAGIYESGFEERDNTGAYASLHALQSVAGVDSVTGTQIDVRLPKDSQGDGKTEEAAAEIQEAFVNAYSSGTIPQLHPVDNIRHTGAVFFNWLDLLDTNVTVIFILMLCVAGFTLVSSMFIIILERIPTIGLLRSVGATKSTVERIFVAMAMRIVAIGLVAGNTIGLGLLLIQRHFKVLSLDPQMYYLSTVPVEINWTWMALLNIGVVAAAYLILILPSRLAGSISPASTLRYE